VATRVECAGEEFEGMGAIIPSGPALILSRAQTLVVATTGKKWKRAAASKAQPPAQSSLLKGHTSR
jgi:hypothetical protein